MFADHVDIEIKAGKGGDGRLSFRHEKYRAYGGADGGDGGRGGDLIMEVDHNLDTLSFYRNHRLHVADGGQVGGSNRSAGKAGGDIVLKVPVGTMVYRVNDDNPDDKTLIIDLAREGQSAIIAKGGRGGFGNAHFKSSTRQTPKLAELGEPGQELRVVMELKMVADIGLVGLPNAGKSTLLSVISNAKPEIGDYPFTTLIPNLGVVDIDSTAVLVADIPGLIEGASVGKGLGDEFLRHIERTAVLWHLIDVQSDDLVKDFNTITAELKAFNPALLKKKRLIILTKSEVVDEKKLAEAINELKKHTKLSILAISAQAHRGLTELLRSSLKPVLASRAALAKAAAEALPIIDESSLETPWQVETLGEQHYRVTGSRIERFGVQTDFGNSAGVDRLRDIMRKTGIATELEKQAAEPNAIIELGDKTFRW